MEHQDQHSLLWQTYSDHHRDMLHNLWTTEDFADVTLVCDDKKQLSVHRNILSACSPFFKTIFQIDLNNNHPVIYLRGVEHADMISILQFIYLGEVSFDQGRVNEFLLLAKDLEIKELLKAAEVENPGPIDNEQNAEDTSEFSATLVAPDENGKNEVEANMLKENKDVQPNISIQIEENHCDSEFLRLRSLRGYIQSEHEGVKHACNQCDYQATQQSTLTRHIQSAHEGVKYACNQCDYQATQHGSLKTHIQSKHEGTNYVCKQCDYQASTPSNLTRHIQSKHEGIRYACNQCDYQATGLIATF